MKKKTEVQTFLLHPSSPLKVKACFLPSQWQNACLQGAALPVPSCLGTVYSKHTSSEVQPKYGRGLFLMVVVFSLLLLLIFYQAFARSTPPLFLDAYGIINFCQMVCLHVF